MRASASGQAAPASLRVCDSEGRGGQTSLLKINNNHWSLPQAAALLWEDPTLFGCWKGRGLALGPEQEGRLPGGNGGTGAWGPLNSPQGEQISGPGIRVRLPARTWTGSWTACLPLNFHLLPDLRTA